MNNPPPKLQVVPPPVQPQQQQKTIATDDLNPTKLEWYKEAKRPIATILADLSKPIPKQFLAQRQQGAANLIYLPWYHAVQLLDRCTGGHWDYYITHIHTTDERLILTASITIHAAEGTFTRQATGTETLKEEYLDKNTKSKQIREWAYGDTASKSESMALRRAAAKFGLARYLYERER